VEAEEFGSKEVQRCPSIGTREKQELDLPQLKVQGMTEQAKTLRGLLAGAG
jgi:hypothetical protein